jgi:hypothetical protein
LDSAKKELINKELDGWYVSEGITSPQERIQNPNARRLVTLKGIKSQEAPCKEYGLHNTKQAKEVKKMAVTKQYSRNKVNQRNIQKVANNEKHQLHEVESIPRKDEMRVEEAKSLLKKDESKKKLEEIERQYMEEGYDAVENSLESSIKQNKYNFLDGLTESKAMEAMINRLYAEMPDLQSSCEVSQQENPPAIY